MIPQLFDRLHTVVHQFLDEHEYVSCTTDIWSTPSQDSLLSFTAHFLTPTFERKQVILQAVKLNESHTGADIATLINSCIQYWKIAEKFTYLVRDNAANYVAGLRDAGISNFECLAHTLQLVIHDSLSPTVCSRSSVCFKEIGRSTISTQMLLYKP